MGYLQPINLFKKVLELIKLFLGSWSLVDQTKILGKYLEKVFTGRKELTEGTTP